MLDSNFHACDTSIDIFKNDYIVLCLSFNGIYSELNVDVILN